MAEKSADTLIHVNEGVAAWARDSAGGGLMFVHATEGAARTTRSRKVRVLKKVKINKDFYFAKQKDDK